MRLVRLTYYVFILVYHTIVRLYLKRSLKNSYLHTDCKIISYNQNKNEYSFFGYYNISPFNKNGDILVCECNSDKKRASLEYPLKIRLISERQDKNEIIAITNSWNWQQGCMLQWYSNSDDKIIYNNFDEIHDDYFAEILNIKSKNIERICKPVYSIAKDGSFALTLNFDRLAIMRPDYGYFNKRNKNLPNDSYDGIWLINIRKNKDRLILSLETLKKFKSHRTMIDSKHKVNHIDISPDGKRFMFLHRWIGPEGRFMRLLTANCNDGSNLFYITGNEMVSHNCWVNNNEIISFCRLKDGRDRYVHFIDKEKTMEIIGDDDFSRDGHPSVSPDGRWMLTDDYPDKAKFSRLYLYNIKNRKKYIIGEFYQPLKYLGEKRIDLHPKWSMDGKFVSIDSGHNGKRSLYIIDISRLL